MPKGYFTRAVRIAIYPIGPNIAYIPLTKGLYALIDAEDIPLVSSHNWCVNGRFGSQYALRRANDDTGKEYHIRMHRLLMDDGTPIVDHVNGNTLDNRKSNLRGATQAENLKNRKKGRNNRSGFKGVCREGNGWKAVITASGKVHYLGVFDTPEEAHEAYIIAAQKYHGEFARFE